MYLNESTAQSQHTIQSRLEALADAVNQLSQDEFRRFTERLRRPVTVGKNEPASAHSSSSKLTKRESEVLTLVASGYSRREIGLALSISENTAACHISSIYRKLEISTIAEATRFAISCGAV